MVARNEHTGAEIKTKPASTSYRENWDKVFGKDPTEGVVQRELPVPDKEQEPELG